MSKYLDKAREIIAIEIDGLKSLEDNLSSQFEQAIEAMKSCLDDKGKIVVSGIGKSLHVAQKISSTLTSTGASSVVLNPAQALHGDLGVVTAGDCVIIVSHSGASDEILDLIPILKGLEATLIAITGLVVFLETGRQPMRRDKDCHETSAGFPKNLRRINRQLKARNRCYKESLLIGSSVAALLCRRWFRGIGRCCTRVP